MAARQDYEIIHFCAIEQVKHFHNFEGGME